MSLASRLCVLRVGLARRSQTEMMYTNPRDTDLVAKVLFHASLVADATKVLHRYHATWETEPRIYPHTNQPQD